MNLLLQRYTNALITAAKEANAIEDVSKDIEFLNRVLSDSEQGKNFKTLITTPLLSQKEHNEHLFAIMKEIHPLTKNFLTMLIGRRRENLIPNVATVFFHLKRKMEGIVLAKISSAVSLDESQVLLIQEKLQSILKKNVESKVEVRPELIGGMVIEVDGKRFDSSLQRVLDELRSSLLV